MEACFRGHLESAKQLINHGGSWLSRDYCGFSALHYAVDGGHLHVMSHMLSEGVPADEVGENTLSRWTPLMRTGTMIIIVSCAVLIRSLVGSAIHVCSLHGG